MYTVNFTDSSCVMVLYLAFAAALAFDPYENEAPLGPETGCMMHSLAYEYAQHLMGDRAPEGSRRKKQVHAK